MRDPSEFSTPKGTPWILVISRVAFVLFFIYALYATVYPPTPDSTLEIVWVFYLMAIYAISEKLYAIFRRKDIDMAFAFPLILAVNLINLASQLLGGQEELPIMNRIEHFASFVLLAYVLAVFFSEYLPQRVWKEHPYYTALLILAVTSLAGVGNEIFELFSDVVFGTKRIGKDFDTALDLLMNTLGAGLLLAVRLVIHTEPTKRSA